MLLLLLGISITVLIAGIIIYYNSYKYETCGECMIGMSIIAIVVFLTATICCGVCYSSILSIDDKIAVCQEENAAIEESISTIVANYQDYEYNTLKELKPDELVLAVRAYPELSSDELTKSQIELYISNKEEIIELKKQKVDLKVIKWWLFF